MRTLLYALPAVGLLAWSGPALAGEASGLVTDVNVDERMIELANGEQFKLGESISDVTIEQIQLGSTAIVIYEEQDGQKVASTLELQGGGQGN